MNGTIVQATFDRISGTYGRRALAAITQADQQHVHPYWTNAAMSDAEEDPASAVAVASARRGRPGGAAIAKTLALKATGSRAGAPKLDHGRGVAKTSTPTSQPKRAIAATPKTKPSETPLASTPSTGTG